MVKVQKMLLMKLILVSACEMWKPG